MWYFSFIEKGEKMENKVDIKKVGETIAKLRKKNGMTQMQLAEKLYVSDKAISRWETGEGLPEIVNLMELSKIFNVSLESLLKAQYIEEEVSVNNAVEEPIKEQSENSSDTIENPKKEQNQNTHTHNTQNVSVPQKVAVQNKPQKAEDKHFVANIISVVLGGVSILSNLVFPIFIGLILAVIGLVLSKNPEKTTLHKVGKLLNIAGIIISLITMLIILIVMIAFGTQFLEIFDLFKSVQNGF